MTSTLGSEPEKSQERNQGKSDHAWGKKPEKIRRMHKKQRAPMGQKGATHVNQKQQ
jgi:hypothetical protein